MAYTDFAFINNEKCEKLHYKMVDLVVSDNKNKIH